MKPNKILSLTLATIFTISLTGNLSADPYGNYDVRYNLVVSHAHDLEYIADDLKDCFRDQFRHSRLYGKLISRSNKLRNRARSLHRHGVSRGTCNWHQEIHRIYDLVCELDRLVDEAIIRSRSGYDGPLCGNTVRTVRRLVSKANYHASGLKDALFRVNLRPRFDNPIINQPAPNFPPAGVGFNRGNDFINQYYANSNRRNFAPNRSTCGVGNRSGLDFDRNGFSVNTGGLRFYVDR